MGQLSPNEFYKDLLASAPKTVDYEVGAAIGDTAKIWASLAEKLVFALKSEGLASIDPALLEEYRLATLVEPEKF